MKSEMNLQLLSREIEPVMIKREKKKENQLLQVSTDEIKDNPLT